MPAPEKKPEANDVDPDKEKPDTSQDGDDKKDKPSPGGTGGDNPDNEPEGDEPDGLDALDDKTKSYLKKLRSENARYRTESKNSKQKLAGLEDRFNKLQGGLKKALGLEDDDQETDPEKQVGVLQSTVESLQFGLAVRDVAMTHGLTGADSVEFLEHLIMKEQGSLGEDEEISDERMAEIVDKVKTAYGAKDSGGPKRSGVTPPGGKPTPAGGDNITAEDFAAMTLDQKTRLREKDQAKYDMLMVAARAKRLIK